MKYMYHRSNVLNTGQIMSDLQKSLGICISLSLTRSTTHADYTIRDFEMQTASVAYTVYTHTL